MYDIFFDERGFGLPIEYYDFYLGVTVQQFLNSLENDIKDYVFYKRNQNCWPKAALACKHKQESNGKVSAGPKHC